MKKAKTNIKILEETAKGLGLHVQSIQTSTHSQSLLISNKHKFYLANSGEPGFYPEARGWNILFAKSKMLTQNILEKKGYHVINSQEIRIADFSSASKLALHLKSIHTAFPILIKPDLGLRGRGIAVANSMAALKTIAISNYNKKKDFMLQPIVTANEYRILVVNGEIMLMHSKQNPFVTGDGVSTIQALLADIQISKQDATFIESQHLLHGSKNSTVLEKGVQFEYHLTKKPSTAFYRTDNFPLSCKKWALKLAKDIHMSVVGIDVFIPKGFADTSSYTIIELNSNPGVNYLPTYCNDSVTPRRVFEKVLTDYFDLVKKA